MELKYIKELMAAMEEAGLTKISIKEKTGFELHLEREKEPAAEMPHMVHHPYSMMRQHEFPHIHQGAHPHPSHHAGPSVGSEMAAPKQEEKKEGKFITSPMVGTFYPASSPEHAAFVKIGDQVNENTIVCIIEAMKVMNEVKSGVSGVVAEVYLDNGHPVEFGTKLFRIV